MPVAVPGRAACVDPAAGLRRGIGVRRAVTDDRRPTLRRGTASLTQTARRAPRGRHDRAAGEDAR
ncbi:DUF6380 family protein [Streptomyces sp. NPDC058735]|uniref:DUF6380 family protein n=1 Tax=unclassified Streptomyces TaxID=2593676 RepID=UPI00367B20CD